MKELNLRIQRDNLNDVFYEDVAGPGNGRHHYSVVSGDGEELLLDVRFQNGARKDPSSESGVFLRF